MGANSKIEWTHHTFNPWWGCTKVSPACDYCYAETLANRYGFQVWGKGTPRRFFGDKHWNQLLKWDRKAASEEVRYRVFCGSECDILEEREDVIPHRVRLFGEIDITKNLDYLLLTKRPQNYRKMLPAHWLDTPRPNVWGMTTVESDKYLWRVAELVKTPFAVRGLSCEPLLGPIDLTPWLSDCALKCLPDLPRIDWVIAGGESGPHARPSHPDWFRAVRDQCVKAGVPFFFKQWGQWCEWDQLPEDTARDVDAAGDGHYSGARYFKNKSDTGRLLDGVEWSQFPGGVR